MGAAIIPERDRMCAPAEAAGPLRLVAVVDQEAENSLTLQHRQSVELQEATGQLGERVELGLVGVADDGVPQKPATGQPLRDGDGSQGLITKRSAWFNGSFLETRIYNRDRLAPGDTFGGPAIISEYSSATVLPPGDTLRVDALRNVVLTGVELPAGSAPLQCIH